MVAGWPRTATLAAGLTALRKQYDALMLRVRRAARGPIGRRGGWWVTEKYEVFPLKVGPRGCAVARRCTKGLQYADGSAAAVSSALEASIAAAM